MQARHEGSRWVVVGKRKHVLGRHKTKRKALTQEGAVHLHIRQGKSGNTLLTIFGPAKKKRRKKSKR